MNPIDKLLERLQKVRGKPPKWRSLCPAHENKNTLSLSVCEAEDGRVLIRCFAGCGAVSVMEAVGLTLRDLFPGGPLGHYIPSRKRNFRLPEAEYGLVGARKMRENLDEAKREIKRLRQQLDAKQA